MILLKDILRLFIYIKSTHIPRGVGYGYGLFSSEGGFKFTCLLINHSVFLEHRSYSLLDIQYPKEFTKKKSYWERAQPYWWRTRPSWRKILIWRSVFFIYERRFDILIFLKNISRLFIDIKSTHIPRGDCVG